MNALPDSFSRYTGVFQKNIASFPLPGGLRFELTYFLAVAMAALIFLLILMLGQLRHRFAHWQMSGVVPGIAFGFVMALILEGIFILGGRTILTELLGWENAPKPVAVALDAGRNRLVRVLGVTDEIPSSLAEESSAFEGVLRYWERLTPGEEAELEAIICTQ